MKEIGRQRRRVEHVSKITKQIINRHFEARKKNLIPRPLPYQRPKEVRAEERERRKKEVKWVMLIYSIIG